MLARSRVEVEHLSESTMARAFSECTSRPVGPTRLPARQRGGLRLSPTPAPHLRLSASTSRVPLNNHPPDLGKNPRRVARSVGGSSPSHVQAVDDGAPRCVWPSPPSHCVPSAPPPRTALHRLGRVRINVSPAASIGSLGASASAWCSYQAGPGDAGSQ